jgi:RNA polymerase sigma-70 factor, ECF subfamily
MTDHTSSPDDHDMVLLRRFAAGERAALGDLARRHERSLLGLARGILDGDSEAACDAVQAMWVRVIRYAKGFKGNSEVKTWLYRILINECRDMRRDRAMVGGPATLRLAQEARTDREHDGRLHSTLAALPNEKREILLLCYHAGVTHQIASEILEIPIGTLKSRLHAALKDLRAALGEPGETEVVA